MRNWRISSVGDRRRAQLLFRAALDSGRPAQRGAHPPPEGQAGQPQQRQRRSRVRGRLGRHGGRAGPRPGGAAGDGRHHPARLVVGLAQLGGVDHGVQVAGHRPRAPQPFGGGIQRLDHGFPGGRQRRIGGMVDGLAGDAQQFLDGGHHVRGLDRSVVRSGRRRPLPGARWRRPRRPRSRPGSRPP